MSEVHRYKAVELLSFGGSKIQYTPHGPDVVRADEFDRLTAENQSLQQRLTTADQRIDELETQLADREQSRRAWFDQCQSVERGSAQKYDDTLLPFVALMRRELHANADKGDRPGWLTMSADTCLLEIIYHFGKLQASVKRGDGDGMAEYAADVANMCMMLLDICGALHISASAEPAEEDWRMNPCKQGHRDVGAAGGVAHCYTCDERITAATTQEAFEQWNATHPAAEPSKS